MTLPDAETKLSVCVGGGGTVLRISGEEEVPQRF